MKRMRDESGQALILVALGLTWAPRTAMWNFTRWSRVMASTAMPTEPPICEARLSMAEAMPTLARGVLLRAVVMTGVIMDRTVGVDMKMALRRLGLGGGKHDLHAR